LENNIHHLIEKYLDGSISPSEEKQLIDWYQNSNEADTEWVSENTDEEEQVRIRILMQVHQQTGIPVTGAKTVKRLWYRIAAAASVLLFLGVASYLIYPLIHQSSPQAVTAQLVNDIGPGGNKAILTLDNGKKVVLEDAKNGMISRQGSTLVNKTSSGNLLYNVINNEETAVVYNTVSTPYGGQYQVTLLDGTKVWLNAGASLRFPTSFPGHERNVELNGEAYFEVAKDKTKPFFVTVNTPSGKSMTVQVLGTHFNVNAYPDEQHNITTLLEGSVKVNYEQENVLLIPGKQAVLNKASGKMNIRDADTEEATAWKNGYFLFNNDKVENIMRQISRWYNVEINYQGDVSKKAIGGSVSRFKNVSEVLKMLELTGAVHFKMEGRRITVMP